MKDIPDECPDDDTTNTQTEDVSGSTVTCNSQKPRKSSTRRKKKWKRKVTKEEFDAPYSHQDNIDTDTIDDLEQIAQGRHDGRNFDIERTVPTLSELCLRINSLHRRDVALSDIPAPGVKKLVKGYTDNQSLRSLQLAWLHKILQFYDCLATQDAIEGDSRRKRWHQEWLIFVRGKKDEDYQSFHVPSARTLWGQKVETSGDEEHGGVVCAISLLPVSELSVVTGLYSTGVSSLQNISGKKSNIFSSICTFIQIR